MLLTKLSSLGEKKDETVTVCFVDTGTWTLHLLMDIKFT